MLGRFTVRPSDGRHDVTGTIDVVHDGASVALDLTTAYAIRVVQTDS
jgi:hypothetical protein